MSLVRTWVPDGPSLLEIYSEHRRTIQVIKEQARIETPVIKKAPAISIQLGNSAISEAIPITTAIVPGPLIPGMAKGKKE